MIVKGTIVDTNFDTDRPYFRLKRGNDTFRCHAEQPMHTMIKIFHSTGKPVEIEARISRADFWVNQIREGIESSA